jgi:hypothetical protein
MMPLQTVLQRQSRWSHSTLLWVSIIHLRCFTSHPRRQLKAAGWASAVVAPITVKDASVLTNTAAMAHGLPVFAFISAAPAGYLPRK